MTNSYMWDINLFTEGDQESKALWSSTISALPGNTLFIIGIGFDERMYLGIEKLFCGALNSGKNLSCIGLKGAAPAEDIEFRLREEKNIEKTKALFSGNYEEINYQQSEGNRSTAVCLALQRYQQKIKSFDNIIVDISAMPRITFLTLIPQLLYMLHDHKFECPANKKNLIVMASESREMEDAIKNTVIKSEAVFLHQFDGGCNTSSAAHLPGVWFPILSKIRKDEITAIYSKIDSAVNVGLETALLLPFPSRAPRLSDDILSEHAVLLFQSFELDYNNILYAAENRPFELYRRLMSAFYRYSHNLANLGGGRFFVSPLCGKLMAIGAILACYEAQGRLPQLCAKMNNAKFHFGVSLVEPIKYSIEEYTKPVDSNLSMLWLLGSAYNV